MAKDKKSAISSHFAHLKESPDKLAIAATAGTIFLSTLILASFFTGDASRVFELISNLRTFVFPWLFAILLLSIAKELWAIRVYARHIHLGSLIEKYAQ